MNQALAYNPAYTKTPLIAQAFGFDEDSHETMESCSANSMIPADVIRQLREHGVNIEFLSRGDLHDAALAAAHDCVVFDDASGVNFRDQLHLSHEEANTGRGRGRHSFWSNRNQDNIAYFTSN
jgi:hypothetical protein